MQKHLSALLHPPPNISKNGKHYNCTERNNNRLFGYANDHEPRRRESNDIGQTSSQQIGCKEQMCFVEAYV